MALLKLLDLKCIPCPLNVVKVKLALEKLSPNQELIIELDKGEPEEIEFNRAADYLLLSDPGAFFEGLLKSFNTDKFALAREWLDRNIEEKNQDVPKKSQTEEVKNDKNTESAITK